MELDSWVHGLGFADMDVNEVQCCPYNEPNRLPNYCNITSVFISRFSNYRHISKKLIVVNKV